MEINKQYKDRLFRLLFGTEENKANILSLYNALHGTSYSDVKAIELTTIGDALYIGMKNDVSFIIDNRIPLWEQQSSYNPNMPIRGFMYYGKLYDSFIANSGLSLYGSTQIQLPTPQYIVFYNGNAKRPAVEKLKLSNAFCDKSVSNEYEWTATAYNLNDSANNDLLKSCKPLADYTEVVNRIKAKWHSNMSKEEALEAVDAAVKTCIADGILSEFLTKHRTEVIDVCITEFDETKYAKTLVLEGKMIAIAEMVRDGLLSVDDAAKRLGVDTAAVTYAVNNLQAEEENLQKV